MRAIDGGDVKFGAAYVDPDTGFRDEPTEPSPFIPGYDAQFQTLQASNQGSRIHTPFSRRAVDIEPGTFDGSWGWQFTLTGTEWLDAVLGEPEDGVWEGEPRPMYFYVEYPTRTSTNKVVIEGCVADSASVSPRVGDPQTDVTVEGFYCDRYEYTGEDAGWPLGDQPEPTEADILRYHDATLNVDSTERYIVQDARLDVKWPNLQPIEGFDSRSAIGYEVNDHEPSLSYTAAEVAEPEEDLLYGGADSMAATLNHNFQYPMELKFAREGRSLTFNGEGGFPTSYSEDSLGESSSRVDESLDFDLTTVTVEAEATR